MNVFKMRTSVAAGVWLVLSLGVSSLAGTLEDNAYLAATQQFNQHDWDNAQKSFLDFQTHYANSRWRWAVKLRLADLEPDPERAEKRYREVMAQKEAVEWGWDARWGLASALYARGRYPDARELFQGLAQSRDIRRVRAQYYMGLCALALNQLKAARESFTDILEHQPQAEVAGAVMIALGDVELADNHPDLARHWYNQYLQEKPEGEWAAQAQERLKAPEGTGNTLTPVADISKSLLVAEKPNAVLPVSKAVTVLPTVKTASRVPTLLATKTVAPTKVPTSEPMVVAVKLPVAGSRTYCVQVGAFSKLEYAQSMMRKMQGLGLTVFIQDTKSTKEPLHMVRIGPFTTRGEAERQAEQLHQNEGIPTMVVAQSAPLFEKKLPIPTTSRGKP